MFRKTYSLTLLLSLPLAACTAEVIDDGPGDAGPADTGTIGGKDGGVTKDGGTPGFAESTKANLRFKEVIRLTNDFAQALDLPPGEVCLELGQYDCREVHTVTLGGVRPYEFGLFEPMPATTVTTPIAVERVATHACTARVTADLNSGAPAIFVGLRSGTIDDLDSAEVAQSLDQLYKKAVQRPPTEDEIEHLKQLYRDVEGLGVDNPAKDWAIASCIAVLTSVESLFY